jgi:hypothetical protein
MLAASLLAQPKLVENHVEDERKHETDKEQRSPGVGLGPEKQDADLGDPKAGDETDPEIADGGFSVVHIDVA